MGHVNYGGQQRVDVKGLIHFFSTDKTAFKWKAYRIPLNTTVPLGWQEKDEKTKFPKLLKGDFVLARTGDTYFDLTPFFKGYVWVNGQLLGRYWNAGPQHSLYCPGVWLNEGQNTIHILQLGNGNETIIKTRANLF